jgi:hypothetical protein
VNHWIRSEGGHNSTFLRCPKQGKTRKGAKKKGKSRCEEARWGKAPRAKARQGIKSQGNARCQEAKKGMEKGKEKQGKVAPGKKTSQK